MNDVENFLNKHNIVYQKHEHVAVFTCDEADEHRQDIKGISSKNLLLQNKKKSRFFLVIVAAHKQIDLEAFATKVGERKISFASSETLYEILKLTPGSVSPFGLLNDTKKVVEVFIDAEVMTADIVSFHPNANTATLDLSNNMFKRFLSTIDHVLTEIKL